jgi:hypothetical protein
MNRIVCASAVLVGLGCGGGSSPPSEDAQVLEDAAARADGGVLDDATADGPRVYVHLRATHAAVAHDPGTSGQTPRGWSSGIRSLHLLRGESDPDPALVFSHGDDHVEASYADGADTIVGSAPIASLPTGTFTWARAVHTHVRFTIDATVHSSFGAVPGELEDVIALSDRTTIDGATRARGWYRHVFRAGGAEFPAEGTGFELPAIAGGGFSARVEEGETAYYFPAHLEVSDAPTADVHLVFEVNVHDGFRWIDQTTAGYAPSVFDATPPTTEPIVQAGANSYRFSVE